MAQIHLADLGVQRVRHPAVGRAAVGVAQLALQGTIHAQRRGASRVVDAVHDVHRHVGGMGAGQARQLGGLRPRRIRPSLELIGHAVHRLHQEGSRGAQRPFAFANAIVGDGLFPEGGCG